MTPEELAHIKRVEQLALKVRLLYFQAAREAAKFATLPNYDPKKPFSVENYPNTKRGMQKMMQELFQDTKQTIIEGIDKEWYEANRNLDAKVRAKSQRPEPPKEWMQHNEAARDAFKARVDGNGLNLSKRVWNMTEQFKQEMELAIDLGLSEGKSAAELSRDIRSYLNEPDKLFRKVRNKETGRLQLSKAAKAYHPGQGVYRSSYKNAMRLARTETNMAFRSADHERSQQLDFILGFEVKLSKSHPVRDICDDLKGKYPKGFKFVGWHTQCFCYKVLLEMDEAEFNRVEDMLLAGEDISGYQSPNALGSVPKGMSDWIKITAPRAQNWANMPYFVRDNFKGGRIENGLDKTKLVPKGTKPVKAAKAPTPAPVKRVKTEAEKVAIQKAWDKRGVDRLLVEHNTIVREARQHLGTPSPVLKALSMETADDIRGTYSIINSGKRADKAIGDIRKDIEIFKKKLEIKKAWNERAIIVQMNDVLDNAQGWVRQYGMETVSKIHAGAKARFSAWSKLSLGEQEIKLKETLASLSRGAPGTSLDISKQAYLKQLAKVQKELLEQAKSVKEPKTGFAAIKYKKQTKTEVKDMLRSAVNNNSKLKIPSGSGAQADLIENYTRVMDGFDMDEFIKDLTVSLNKRGVDIENISLNSPWNNAISIEIEAKGMSMTRTFTLAKDGLREVAHDFFKLSSRYQSGGLSKELFGHLHKQYLKSNMSRVKVHANIDVGGYTWGRYGFAVESRYQAERFLQGAVNNAALRNEGQKAIIAWYKKNPDSAPFPMNLFADIPGFKQWMLGTDWKGTLHLKNPLMRKRFEDYLLGKI